METQIAGQIEPLLKCVHTRGGSRFRARLSNRDKSEEKTVYNSRLPSCGRVGNYAASITACTNATADSQSPRSAFSTRFCRSLASSCSEYLRSDLVTDPIQRAGTYPLTYPSNKYASLRIPHERGQSPRSNFTRLVRGNVSGAAVFPLNYEHNAKTLEAAGILF